MGFGDLKSKSGLEALNSYLADRSYIEGFQPSQADVVVFKALGKAPSADLFNALRWYNQINSYGNDMKSFPGVAKPLDSYGSGGAAPAASKDDDSDFGDDLFGDTDSEEDEETKKRVAEYTAKKAKKTAIIAKSSLLLDIKPWDDETDMKEMERLVRTIEMEGLVWGAGKLIPVGYGIKKLQINAVIEDDKVSTDDLEEKITSFEDLVQSMDIAAFNKI
ncbi:elongation factor 1-beta-like [Ruditapes philippinarum]|uniref:elongation factor 1-beta-like n=1 Tax=Ruditapes philippinarum TaxID=129788 RepID=UPI00295AAE1F|nr:elongation factor 1-beta-like [Ruditapes philippinarum]